MNVETKITLETDHEKILVKELLENYGNNEECYAGDTQSAFVPVLKEQLRKGGLILLTDSHRNLLSSMAREARLQERKCGPGTNSTGDQEGRNYIYKQLEAASTPVRVVQVHLQASNLSQEAQPA